MANYDPPVSGIVNEAYFKTAFYGQTLDKGAVDALREKVTLIRMWNYYLGRTYSRRLRIAFSEEQVPYRRRPYACGHLSRSVWILLMYQVRIVLIGLIS